MDGIIIYDSKYGATRQYAQWLSEELGLPLRTASETQNASSIRSGFVLIGTPVYFGKFRIRKWLHKYGKKLSGKKLFFFVVSGSGSSEIENRNSFVKSSIPSALLPNSEVHFLDGRMIHKDLSFLDRLAMKMGEWGEKDPAKKAAMHEDHDNVRKANLVPLIQSVNNFRSLARKEALQDYTAH